MIIIDLDPIFFSNKALDLKLGGKLTDPQKVFDKAEEMAAHYVQMLLEKV